MVTHWDLMASPKEGMAAATFIFTEEEVEAKPPRTEEGCKPFFLSLFHLKIFIYSSTYI